MGFSKDLTLKILELKRKGIAVNDLFIQFLHERELKIAQEKERLARESEDVARECALAQGEDPVRQIPSRYIPMAIKNILKQEFGEKCAAPTCTKPSQTIHHTRRFALSQNHNPYFLAPLCEEHHAIAHSIDMNVHSRRLLSASGP